MSDITIDGLTISLGLGEEARKILDDVSFSVRAGEIVGLAGLGLGLPGTLRLVGRMSLESEPGVGTTVTVTKWKSAPPEKEEPA